MTAAHTTHPPEVCNFCNRELRPGFTLTDHLWRRHGVTLVTASQRRGYTEPDDWEETTSARPPGRNKT